MGKILDFLQAAAGEASLHTLLGKWRSAISQEVDIQKAQITNVTNVSQSLLTELDVIGTKRGGADQVGVTTGSDVVLNNLIFTRGATQYDPNTGIYTLIPGRIYELDAGGAVSNFSSPAGGFLEIAWVYAATNTPIVTNVSGIYKPSTQVNASSNGGRTHAVFVPGGDGDENVKLRVVDSTGTADISLFFGCVVKQLR
jgi:hypothetical protein